MAPLLITRLVYQQYNVEVSAEGYPEKGNKVLRNRPFPPSPVQRY